ncbi:MAG: FtsW/RodA/SpoVE family cell cycle protein [Prevotellaceae bacterium]|jgi:cell division protein FtsW|nr:FtsW/RodA/SpoVE family cell cycle protein [Prevotellaceae bacterium]
MYASLLKNIKGDKTIWGVVLFLFLFSLLVIYSSTNALAAARGTTATSYLIKQFAYVFIAFVVMYLMHIIPIGWYRSLSIPALAITVLLILATFFFGVKLNDGTRWFPLPFGLTFQPSDIARIAIILYTAKVMEIYDLSSFRDFAKKLLLPVGVIFLLIIWSSTSTALLLAFTLAVLLFVGGIKISHLLKTAGILVVSLAFILLIGKTTNWFPRVETATNRVTTFFSKSGTNKGDVFQITQSKIAVAKGGWGVGPGNSNQRLILPHPYSDFIYAIIIEEYGVAGGVAVILLYLILLFRAIVIARSCTRVFPMIMVLGLVFMITFQAMVNMGVAVGILPVTGQPLPLLSQGGSSLITFCMALGMVLAVSRAAEERDMKQQ